jgi:hypothetical protein
MKKYLLIILSALAIASCPAAALTALAADISFGVQAHSGTITQWGYQYDTCGDYCGNPAATANYILKINGSSKDNIQGHLNSSDLFTSNVNIDFAQGDDITIYDDSQLPGVSIKNQFMTGTISEACNPDTITNGTIGPYPDCAITCDNGYHEDAGACVVDTGPGPGPSSGGSSISPGDLTLGTGLSADIVQSVSGVVSEPGVLALLVVAIGIPLFFFIVAGAIDLLNFQKDTDKEFKRVMKKYD